MILLLDIYDLLCPKSLNSISSFLRSFNNVAHCSAKRAIIEKGCVIWLESVPKWVDRIVHSDVLFLLINLISKSDLKKEKKNRASFYMHAYIHLCNTYI